MQEGKFKFPYRAKTSQGLKRFDSIEDVERELLITGHEAEKEGYNEGEACYYEHLFWANSHDLIDTKSQTMIKSFLYCQESNTPPFKSLENTPASFIDSWMIVANEIKLIKSQEMKNAKQYK
tara:strand:+ start:219 stop:584 length:366 start_codon:yes stop_codon:yes gene_type:complete